MKNKKNVKYPKIEIENMLEPTYIKEGGEQVLGAYHDRVGLNGFYLRATRGSLLERIEKMACLKFQLENDPENYKQEARLDMWLSLNKYYDKFGYDENKKADGFIYTDCKFRQMDRAKLAKSNVSVCDRSTGKYHINKIESYEKKFIEEIDKLRNQRDERYISELYSGDIDEDQPINEFRRWLYENMESVLTKKQVDYLRGDFIIDDVSSVWRINKNICQRITKAYENSKEKEDRIKKINKRLHELQELLDFKDEEDFIRKLVKLGHNEKGRVIVGLYENLTMDNCKILTEIINTNGEVEVSKEFYYDIIAVLTYNELDLKTRIEEIEEGVDF